MNNEFISNRSKHVEQVPLSFLMGEENPDFLRQQLITYIGNKRSLLPFIGKSLTHVQNRLGKSQISFCDMFAGSGVVSRYARQFSHHISSNDLEEYSYIINRCYNSNRDSIDRAFLCETIESLHESILNNPKPGFITKLYSPNDDRAIKTGERVFYTKENAIYLDTAAALIKNFPDTIKPFLLAPLLSMASVHTNTSGVFKGFYKDKDGLGSYGGSGKNALKRILGKIRLKEPVVSEFDCTSTVTKLDSNLYAKSMPHHDVTYLDPPYNQHPYGSNYFMLNLLCSYEYPSEISKVSGIPKDWNRSKYNKRLQVSETLFSLVDDINSPYVIISYSSEGFVPFEEFEWQLKKFGKLSVLDRDYNTFRGCRNLQARNTHLKEFLFVLEKR